MSLKYLWQLIMHLCKETQTQRLYHHDNTYTSMYFITPCTPFYTVKLRPWKGGGSSIPYPINFFKKYPISFKKIRQLSPNIRKLCIPIFQKLIKVSHIPLFFYKNIPHPFNFLANIPISLNTLPGPQNWGLQGYTLLIFSLKSRLWVLVRTA